VKFEARWGPNFHICTSARRPVEPSLPPVQLVTGAYSPRVKRQEHEADYSPPTNAEIKKYSPIRLHVVVLSWLSTGTTLTFYLICKSIRGNECISFPPLIIIELNFIN
jgi:hypothetical protein